MQAQEVGITLLTVKETSKFRSEPISLLLIYKLLQIATRMVLQYGWGPDDSPAIYYSSNAVLPYFILFLY